MNAGFEIKGLKEVNKSLYAYSRQLGDKVVLSALTLGLTQIRNSARANAPYDTGRLKRGIVIKRSKINNGRRNLGKIGVYLTLRKGKGRKDKKDAFYGRFLEDGYNVRGKSTSNRREIISVFGSRTGRKSAPGKSDFQGLKYIDNAFKSRRQSAIDTTVAAIERGSEIVKRKVGLR